MALTIEVTHQVLQNVGRNQVYYVPQKSTIPFTQPPTLAFLKQGFSFLHKHFLFTNSTRFGKILKRAQKKLHTLT